MTSAVTLYECRHCRTPLPPSRLNRRPDAWSSREGTPFPLGVRWIPEEQSYNFALYSKHAEEVELLFFAENRLEEPVYVYRFDMLRNKSGPIWHCRIPVERVNEARFYGYHIDGPLARAGFEMHTFDREKLLLDPYAGTVFFPADFDRTAAQRRGSTVGRAPFALLDECHCPFEWDSDRHLRHEGDLVVYEMHVRGFTNNPNSGVPAERRGTFLGLIDKIPHLVDLGVTAVELMPIFQFDPQEENYWGYMPMSFFAPHHGYAAQPGACARRASFAKWSRPCTPRASR